MIKTKNLNAAEMTKYIALLEYIFNVETEMIYVQWLLLVILFTTPILHF